MGKVVTHRRTFEILEIDGQWIGYDQALTIEFQREAVIVTGRCGGLRAPMRLNLWSGQISLGRFEQRADGCDQKDAITRRTLEALRTVSDWEMVNEHEVMELSGDHHLRLLN
jgi:hypothetical protein